MDYVNCLLFAFVGLGHWFDWLFIFYLEICLIILIVSWVLCYSLMSSVVVWFCLVVVWIIVLFDWIKLLRFNDCGSCLIVVLVVYLVVTFCLCFDLIWLGIVDWLMTSFICYFGFVLFVVCVVCVLLLCCFVLVVCSLLLDVGSLLDVIVCYGFVLEYVGLLISVVCVILLSWLSWCFELTGGCW